MYDFLVDRDAGYGGKGHPARYALEQRHGLVLFEEPLDDRIKFSSGNTGSYQRRGH